MTVNKRLRYEIMRRDGFVCQYCFAARVPLTVDHIVPRSLGGSDHPTNLVAACIPCNAGKSSSLPGGSFVDNCDVEELELARASLIKKASPESSCRGHVSLDGALSYVAELYGLNVEFWLLYDNDRPELHRPSTPCVDARRLISATLANAIQAADKRWAMSLVAEECEWLEELPGDLKPFWSIPAAFCAACLPVVLLRHNRTMPQYVLEGKPRPTLTCL